MKQITFVIEGYEEAHDVDWPLTAADPLPGDMVEIEFGRGQFISGVVKWRKFERHIEGAFYMFRTTICVEEVK